MLPMKPQQLESLRKSRGLTREQLAAELGGCTAQAIVKWERGERAIPAWVEEKMMRCIPVTLPLDELHLLLTEAQASGLAAETIIAEALRLWLHTHRKLKASFTSHGNPDLVDSGACSTHPSVPSAVFTSHFPNNEPPLGTATIVPLPPQHVAALNEEHPSPSVTEHRVEKTYKNPRRKSS